MLQIKKAFPILKNITYLDSAATTQKPQIVIDAISNHYKKINSNVHRGLYKIAHETDKKWIEAHKKVAEFLNAKTYKEIFFTKNTTEGINWISNTVKLNKKDVVIITEAEHHSNLLPWLKLQDEKEIIVERIKIGNDGKADINHFEELLSRYGKRVKIVSVVHISNVLGTVNPIKEIIQLAEGLGALTVVDAAQSVAHIKVDVQDIGCDVLVFSSHKIYGPSGIGVVYCKEKLLESFEPWLRGGEMVSNVSLNSITYSELPWRFEAGTPAVEAGIGLSTALDWFHKTIQSIGGWDEYERKEKNLTKIFETELKKIKGLEFVGGNIERNGIISFNIEGIHPHDIASLLDEQNICVRAGYHCAQPIHDKYHVNGSVRVSLGIYNSEEEVDILMKALRSLVVELNI